jgi:hypothetical protein
LLLGTSSIETIIVGWLNKTLPQQQLRHKVGKLEEQMKYVFKECEDLEQEIVELRGKA